MTTAEMIRTADTLRKEHAELVAERATARGAGRKAALTRKLNAVEVELAKYVRRNGNGKRGNGRSH